MARGSIAKTEVVQKIIATLSKELEKAEGKVEKVIKVGK